MFLEDVLRVTKAKGYRSGSRRLLKKTPRERGMQPLGRLLQKYKPGEKVVIVIDPSVHKGMPHRRFHGKVGVILENRGRSYCISIKDGGKIKKVIARPEHIEPYE